MAAETSKNHSQSSNLTEQELSELFLKCHHGDPEAREQLILHYLPFVQLLALQHCSPYVPYDDLYQEGCYGLILALKKYDFTRDTKFKTFASFYIKKYIKKALIRQNLTLPIVYPEDFFYEFHRYINAVDELSESLKRTPSDKEIADKMNLPEKRIQFLKQHTYQFISYQATFTDNQSDSKSTYNSTYKDYADSAESTALRNIGAIDLSFLNIKVTARELDVLCRRLGFTEDGHPQTIDEISEKTGLSYHVVGNIYSQVTQKIRNEALKKKYTPSTTSF